MQNDPKKPELARAAQDVKEYPARERQGGYAGFARGGAGNHVPVQTGERSDSKERERDGKGLAEKGKEFLGGVARRMSGKNEEKPRREDLQR